MTKYFVEVHFTAWPSLYSRAVAWFTRAPFAHVHLKLVENKYAMYYEAAADRTAGYFTTFADGAIHHRYYRIPLEHVQWQRLTTFLDEQEGKPYDWLGIAAQVVKLPVLNLAPLGWYCSNLARAALSKAFVLPRQSGFHNVTPMELYKELGKIYDNNEGMGL